MERASSKVPQLGLRKGHYYATWYDPAARRTRGRSLRTTDADEAQKRYATFLLEKESRERAQARGEPTVRDALEAYLEEHVEPKCADKDRARAAAGHLTEFFGDTVLSDVDIPMSRMYAEARRAGKIGGGKRRPDKRGSDATIRRELVVLTAAANHARRWKRIKAMPMIELPTEVKKSGVKDAPYLTKAQIDKLIAAADEMMDKELLRWLRITYYTAARRRSISGMLVSQVDLESRQLTLATPGKMQTKKRQPIVPIFNAILDDVQALVAGKKADDKLFVGNNFYRQFIALCDTCGFEGNPHMLRHSRATHLLQGGKKIYDVARLLGDTVATVEKTYGHHSPDALRNNLE